MLIKTYIKKDLMSTYIQWYATFEIKQAQENKVGDILLADMIYV